MPKPNKPTALFTASSWYFEIQGLVSPHFHTLEGINRKTGEVSIVDGGTNIRHKFSDQIKEYADIMLTRAYDGSVDDLALQKLVSLNLDSCTRFDGNLVKLHCGKEVFRIIFLGMRFKEEAHPTLNTASTERYDVKYTASVSEWTEVRF